MVINPINQTSVGAHEVSVGIVYLDSRVSVGPPTINSELFCGCNFVTLIAILLPLFAFSYPILLLWVSVGAVGNCG